MARTADSMLPWPEIITTGGVDLALAQPLQRREPVDARQPDVEQDDVVRARASARSRQASPLSTASTS